MEKMNNAEFFAAVKMLEKEKGIPAELLCERIQAAIVAAIKGENRGKDIGFCEIDFNNGTMNVFVRKNVVSEIADPVTDVLVDEAVRYKETAKPGDIIEVPLETSKFSRIAASTTKNIIRQGIREVERSQLKQELQSRQQEIVTAKVLNVDAATGNATVEIGRGEAVLPKTEQIPGETLHTGDLVKVYVVEIREGDKSGLRIMISRTHPGLVRRLFEEEVPEIYDGTVEIKAVSREAGSRTKIAVFSADENVDAVGSCIGARGARVNKVVDMLGGEKIDIVKYSDDPAQFIAEALKPAEVVSVEVLEDQPNSCGVTVPDNQLSLAIGNKGQNVRLAARLTGWKIDIKPESGFFEIPENV